MQKSTLALISIFFLNISISAQPTVEAELPYHIPQKQIKPLRQLLDKSLQKELEKELNSHKLWKRLLGKKKMAVGLVDISDSTHIKFARVNGDVMMYAASLPKLAVLLAAAQSLEDNTLQPTHEILRDMRIMISKSDNGAATRMIDRLGFEYIQSVLTNPRYELYDPSRGGGLWVGKRYAKRGRRYPDPLMGLSHGASVTQICRFYYLLATGQLVNRGRSVQMLEILSDPEIHHKFVNTLDNIVPDAKLYRKSGTWANWHSDSVMVWGPVWRRYIAAALVEDPKGEKILRELIPVIENILKVQSDVKAKKLVNKPG
ncbi:serine hydrolase [candidate division KSB1 bacterium]|nr:serine hydrolase [candidate division KSB1 bacterium]